MGTTAEKFNYAFGTKDLLKTEINKINNVLTDNSTFRSYPQELFNGYLDILNNGTDTLWNNLEKVSQTGTEAVLEGVETAPMKILLNGNTSQDGEPTPDYPQEVKVVKGENVVSVSGKNLLPFANQDFTIKGVRFYCQGGDLYIDGTSTGEIATNSTAFKDNFKFTLKAGRYSVSTVKDTRVKYIKKYSDNSNLVFFGGNSWIGGFTLDVDTEVYLGIYIANGGVNNNAKQNAMLWNYQDSSDYVPYSKTDYPINLGTLELCKINTYKDYFHKDSGKWYKHKEFDKTILNESSYWYERNVTISGVSRKIFFSRSDKFKSYVSMQNMLCNYFKVKNTYGTSPTANNQFYNNYERTNNLEFAKFEFTTLTEWKEWVASHNIILVGKLATPTEEEITNSTLIEQLEAISKAKSVKDKTYVTQTNDELPFILDVEAIKEYEVN